MKVQDFMPGEGVVAGIMSDIQKYEGERALAHRAVQWRVPLFLGALCLTTIIVALLFNGMADPNERWASSSHVFLYFAAVVAAIFVYAAAMRPARILQQSFRSRVLPAIFGFIEDVRYRHSETPHSFDRLPRDVSGKFNRQGFDDLISGRYEDFPFELYEAKLRHKAGKSESTVFKGVIVAFETISPFPGLLVAVRRAGAITQFFRGVFGSELEELQCGVAAIDEAYEFRTDNPEAARPMVTGRLAQALQWLGETWPEQQARVALKGSDGFLLLPLSRNFFELPGLSVPLDYGKHVEPMVADLAALLATAALVRKIGVSGDAPAEQAKAG